MVDNAKALKVIEERPLFTIVLAVYNVEKYIRATFKSLENQEYPFRKLDIIIVDDGSTDSSYEIVKVWANRHQNVRHLTQENAGPGAARAKALNMARGKWVTVVDPDDLLHPKYFSQIELFTRRDIGDEAVMMTTRVMLLNDETGEITDNHPLDPKYLHGDRLSVLSEEPNNIQLGATALLLTDVVQQNRLTYDHRIKPTFEDGHLLGRYLATFDDPVVGVVASARYLYRKRGDSSSLVQQSWHYRERYIDMLRYGFVDLLRHAKERYGYVPVWTQNMVLYDIMWYFKEDAAQLSRTGWLDDETRTEFLGLLAVLFKYIDIKTIREFCLHGVRWATRESIVTYFTPERIVPTTYFRWRDKPGTGNISITVLQNNLAADLTFYVDGAKVETLHQKLIAHQFFGQTMMLEGEYQLPPGKNLLILCDGLPMSQEKIVGGKWDKPSPSQDAPRLGISPVVKAKPVVARAAAKVPNAISKRVETPLTTVVDRGVKIERALQREIMQRLRRVRNRVTVRSLTTETPFHRALINDANILRDRNRGLAETEAQKAADAAMVKVAQTPAVQRKFKDAWIVMDRPTAAGDNGEHLYRYLLNERPEINAFFLLERQSSDWQRLANEGFRLVPYGSDEATKLCLNAKYKISSDATADVMYPIDRSRFGSKGKFIFLQHGVTKDDISKWISPKAIDLIITVTRAEYESIAGDRSPYKFSHREVALTGFPRFDKIWNESQVASNPKDIILMVPTWRQSLRDLMLKAENDNDRANIFLDSDYGKNWVTFATSPKLMQFAEATGKRVMYVLHPSLTFLKNLPSIANQVELTTFGEIDFPEIVGRTSVMVTDYSSVAFDAAYGGVPVVYYQFDDGDIFNGGHTTRKGYFDYASDGFGPITRDLNETVDNVVALVNDAHTEGDLYRARVESTFPFRDANNCQRVSQAIEALG